MIFPPVEVVSEEVAVAALAVSAEEVLEAGEPGEAGDINW